MRKQILQGFLAAAAIACGLSSAFAVDITGAGATFPFPIYAKWAEAYKAKTGIGMNYQSIGSGGGIAQIKAKTVDFGASDMPLKPEDLQSAGLMQFPAIIGGVVPIVNLEGVAPGAIPSTFTTGTMPPMIAGNCISPAACRSSGFSGASEAPKSTVFALIWAMPPPEPID